MTRPIIFAPKFGMKNIFRFLTEVNIHYLAAYSSMTLIRLQKKKLSRLCHLVLKSKRAISFAANEGRWGAA